MSKLYDISMKITNELPVVKITDELTFTVNNRKSAVLNAQAMLQEMEKKAKENKEQVDETEQIRRTLVILLGEKNAEAVENLDLPINEYREVFKTVFALARGEEPDTQNTPK